MLKFLKIFGGNEHERELKRAEPIVAEVNALEAETAELSDEEMRARVAELREEVQAAGADEEDEARVARAEAEALEDALPEMFALTREAAKRTLGMRHYDVQLIGGVILHRGKIAEMRTGEGKTLVATLPIALNAITGRGVHLVTTNDFLARRDAEWMGRVYHTLGLSVGVINSGDPQVGFLFRPKATPRTTPFGSGEELVVVPRAQAYDADITYGTNNEFGFDYLRDNMVLDLSQQVQRELNYAIVDEVDNILIDEARTPLIISVQGQQATDQYYQVAGVIKRLRKEVDYTVDEKTRSAILTEEGIERVEKMLGVQNLYDPENFQLAHLVEQSLKAHAVFVRDKDYVLVRDGKAITGWDREAEIVIIDEHTGRMMIGRRFSEGLHQAIEAKENVRIRAETQTWATITFQNYFRLYRKLAGMTGTALTEQEEFHKIYNLDVVPIPTHRPMIRVDHPDLVYKTEKAKYDAVVQEIEEMHQLKRPVLVGTASIERSEYLSELLRRRGIPHRVLNAKLHELEASIVAQAGRPGAVTIATNMAGRGVDILLGGNPAGIADEMLRNKKIDPATATPEQHAEALREAEAIVARDRELVRELGGLHIIGTERHEARRIDNQLRGRAGRQGDPGSSRFYLSLEDELMRRFAGGSTVASLMDRFGLEEDVPIESGIVSKAIESAQTKVEGYNFDIRKRVVEMDDVMNKQRTVFYQQRRQILEGVDTRATAQGFLEDELAAAITAATAASEHPEEWDLQQVANAIRQFLPMPPDFNSTQLEGLSRQEIIDLALEQARELYNEREAALGAETMRGLERFILLRTMDQLWVEHLTALDDLREGIYLRAYGQQDPVVAYRREAFELWEQFQQHTRHFVARQLLHAASAPPVAVAAVAAPSPPAAAANRGNGAAAAATPGTGGANGATDGAATVAAAPHEQPAEPARVQPGTGAAPRGPQGRRGVLAAAQRQQRQPQLILNRGESEGRPQPTRVAAKVGRNDPCPCGSGKKYKRCCGANG